MFVDKRQIRSMNAYEYRFSTNNGHGRIGFSYNTPVHYAIKLYEEQKFIEQASGEFHSVTTSRHVNLMTAIPKSERIPTQEAFEMDLNNVLGYLGTNWQEIKRMGDFDVR